MDYLEFYGLEQEPFSSAPISRFYFNSAQHQRALVRLMYAVDTMKGLAVLIGEVGTGKTTLARRMLDSLPEEEYESALLVIIHSGITADWLLSRIARQLGVEDPAPEKLKLLNQLYSRLIELHEQGKKAVVLIDEAQMLHSKEIMEEFRGLLNLELNESKLITFVFFGLPELEDHLQLDEPLAQRVSLKCKLESFTLESTEGYINHRLRLAGAKSGLFPTETIKIVHHFSRGIPRLINTICDNSLFEGYLLKKKVIEPELMKSVVMDLGLAPLPKAKRTAPAQPGQVLKGPGPFRQAAAAPAAPPEGDYAAEEVAEEVEEEEVTAEGFGAEAPATAEPPPDDSLDLGGLDLEAPEPMELAGNDPVPAPPAADDDDDFALPVLEEAEEPEMAAPAPPMMESPAPPDDLPDLEIPMAEEEGLPEGMSVEAVDEDDEALSFMEEETVDDIGLEIEAVPDEPAPVDPSEIQIEQVEDDGVGDFDAMFDDATGGASPPPLQPPAAPPVQPPVQAQPQQPPKADDDNLDSLFDGIEEK